MSVISTSQLMRASAELKERNNSLLGWDGRATQKEVCDEIAYRVRSFSGWPMVSVFIEGACLNVAVMGVDGFIQQLVNYDASTDRATYGRLESLGLSLRNIEELRGFLLNQVH